MADKSEYLRYGDSIVREYDKPWVEKIEQASKGHHETKKFQPY